jgi:hypothetical protein
MMGTQEQKTQIAAARAEFPDTFALRAFPNDTFSISPSSSYVNDSGVVMLYTERLVDGKWLSFAKGSPSELRSQILPFKAPAKVYCECKAVHGGNKHARTLQCDPAPAKAATKKARRFVVVEIVATHAQELMTQAAFVRKYGKEMAQEILAGFIGDTLAFRTVGCGCGEGNDLTLGHCGTCELRKLQMRHDDPGRARQAAQQQERVENGKRGEGKLIRVRLLDKSDGKIYFWTVRHEVINRGWTFTDHEGCDRFVAGNWAALVEHFQLVASNYGFQTNLS